MSGTRSVVSCDEHLRAHRTREAMALTPRTPESRTRSRRLLSSLDPPRGEPKTDILWIPVRARVARRVRALVTRSAGSLAPRLATQTRSTNQRYVRPTSAHSLESIGHPDPVRYRSCSDRCGRRFTTPLRACRGLRSRSERAFSSRRVEMTRATSDTPVAVYSRSLSRAVV